MLIFSEVATEGVLKIKLFLKISPSEKHLCWSLFLIKLQAFRPAIVLRKTPTKVFSYEYCELFNNTCFEGHLRTAASVF